ncbi:MFS transporter [Actinacidiphila bryophytorum]|uniref:MFS transporter n=1 Tax=Actinacidiphila bryophytorum TaxID=1436133 RepID=UPI002176D554|nr:MFS transporter [Actinacidiphila bryophytorum]UWE09629.1 MFS transporter [Actinacidiphila bryophytorum]
MTDTRPPSVRAAAGRPASRKGLALALIALAQMMVVLDVSVVNVALPSIQHALDFSPAHLEWVVNAYALAFGGLLLLGGRVADRYGRRRTFAAGAALLTAAWLLAARAAQGVAGALIAPAALALLTATFAEGAERNRAMGVYGAVSGVGGALGNVLGGVFTDELSWRWVLFINVPVGAFVLAAAPLAFRESEPAAGRLDLPGASAATGGMSLVVYGLINAASHSWGSAATVAPLAAGAALLAAFLVIEARSRTPLMPLRIFADRNRSGAFAVMLAVGSSLIVLFYFLTLFLQVVLHFSPLRTGFSFLAFAVGAAVCATASSALVGRTGPRVLLTAGTAVSAGGMLWLSRIDAHSTYGADVFGPLLIGGCGLGLCFVPLALTAIAGVRGEESGVASALLNTAQQVGGALGLAVLGTVAATATRHRLAHPGADPAAALVHGYAVGFLAAGCVLLAAAAVAALTIRVPAGQRQAPVPAAL